MLSLDECIALSGLARQEVEPVAAYEHCSEVVKATPCTRSIQNSTASASVSISPRKWAFRRTVPIARPRQPSVASCDHGRPSSSIVASA